MFKLNLVLNNLQVLICHKTKPLLNVRCCNSGLGDDGDNEGVIRDVDVDGDDVNSGSGGEDDGLMVMIILLLVIMMSLFKHLWVVLSIEYCS